MNYYIDFDNTLYETAKLTSLMLDAIASSVFENVNKDKEEILEYAKNNFDSTHDNIYSFSEKVAENYNASKEKALNAVKDVIAHREDLVFEDAKRFLIKLKEKGHKIHLLTFLPKTNQEYQIAKVMGSGISSYFDTMIFTTEYKFLLDIDYKNGIFIDDDPRDLLGLLEKEPIKVIRMRKPNNKRSKIEINEDKIIEFENYDDIEIK